MESPIMQKKPGRKLQRLAFRVERWGKDGSLDDDEAFALSERVLDRLSVTERVAQSSRTNVRDHFQSHVVSNFIKSARRFFSQSPSPALLEQFNTSTSDYLSPPLTVEDSESDKDSNCRASPMEDQTPAVHSPVDVGSANFEIDAEGRALRGTTATSENWMNIRQSLPKGLKDFIHFDGLVWALAYAPKLEDVPLFIANRPVMLPPPGFTPFTTTALSPEPPKDPLTFKINPLVPVPDEVLAIACTVFPEAKMFLTLFDSSFIVVYGQEVMCHNMVPFMPETFGGLTVDLVNDDFDFSASGDEAETSDISAMDNAESSDTSSAVDIAESSDTSSVVDGAEPSDTDTKKIVPGNTLFIPGPRYGQEPAKTIPTKAFPFIPHIYHGIKLGEGFRVIMEGVEEDSAFVNDYTKLPYNKLIEVLTPDPPFGTGVPATGRTFGRLFGTAMSQAIVIHNERIQQTPASAQAARDATPHIKMQLSRALLWRTYGPFKSLQGWSGSPLRLISEEDKGQIVGFQNFEWSKRRCFSLGATAKELEEQTEEDAALKTVLAVYPFYGSYNLPTNVLGYQIVSSNN